jgi:hypothetical protein
MSVRRNHEHTCPERPEVKASAEYIRTHPKRRIVAIEIIPEGHYRVTMECHHVEQRAIYPIDEMMRCLACEEKT